jgi:hypothetical protein
MVTHSVGRFAKTTNLEIDLFHSSRAFCNPCNTILDDYVQGLALQMYRLPEILYPFCFFLPCLCTMSVAVCSNIGEDTLHPRGDGLQRQENWMCQVMPLVQAEGRVRIMSCMIDQPTLSLPKFLSHILDHRYGSKDNNTGKSSMSYNKEISRS